uniref:Uncharacterized protein n=1 Tax=Oryzias sinensis TaxID=183150 RepID=A0A8C7ZCL5_9TELE
MTLPAGVNSTLFLKGYDPSMFLYTGQAPSYEKPSAQSSGYSSPQGYYSAGTNTAGGSSDITAPMWYSASYPEQEPAKPTHQRPAQSSGYGSSSGSGSQQSGSQGSQSGAPGSQHQVEQESWSSSDDEEEPEFTQVSEEDQVYAFKTRSRYNQKRLLFSQFRYTPTEPRVPQEPVFPYPSKSHQGKGSAKGSR